MIEKIEVLKCMISEIKEVLKNCNTYEELNKNLEEIFYNYEAKHDIYAEGDWDFDEYAWCEFSIKMKENRDCGKINLRIEEPKA